MMELMLLIIITVLYTVLFTVSDCIMLSRVKTLERQIQEMIIEMYKMKNRGDDFVDIGDL